MIQVLLVFFIACTSSINWLTYTDNVNHFKISYPDTWAKQITSGAVVFLSKKAGDQDIFQENVNLMLQDLSNKSISLEEYTELTKKQIMDNFGASAIVSLNSLTLAGHSAKEFVFNMRYQGRDLKVKQYWLIKENIAYLFSYTAEPSKFDEYDSIATKIIKSFIFF